jgi:hypothetical protein
MDKFLKALDLPELQPYLRGYELRFASRSETLVFTQDQNTVLWRHFACFYDDGELVYTSEPVLYTLAVATEWLDGEPVDFKAFIGTKAEDAKGTGESPLISVIREIPSLRDRLDEVVQQGISLGAEEPLDMIRYELEGIEYLLNLRLGAK